MMKGYRYIFLVAVLFGGVSLSHAITIEECQKLALENYPLIKQYNLIALSEAYDLSNASKNYLPNITGSAQTTWQNHVSKFPDGFSDMTSKLGIDMKGTKKNQYKVGVDVDQLIWDGGQTKSAQDITKASSEVATKEVEVNLYAVRKKINDLYFGILLINRCLQANEELQKVLDSNLSVVNSGVKNGIASESDADAIDAELLSAKQDRIQLEQRSDSYCKMLSLFIKQDIKAAEIEMPQELIDLKITDNNRPELLYFESRKQLLDAQKRKVNSSLMPQIGAFAQGYYGYPGLNMFEAMTNSKWSFNFIAGVMLRWNIGSLYRKDNNLKNIDNEMNMIDIQRETFLFNTQLQQTQISNEIIAKRAVIKDDSKIVALRKSVRNSSEAKLQNGVFTINDLIRDISAENNAIIKMATHNVELLQSIYDYKFTVNN